MIEEPEFQPEINQVDDDQIGEPPQPKANALKFSGNTAKPECDSRFCLLTVTPLIIIRSTKQ